MVEQFANSGDPDQTPRSAASDLGLHCLQVTRLGVSSLQWVKRSVLKLLGIQLDFIGVPTHHTRFKCCKKKKKKKKKKKYKMSIRLV